jgi:hypothetical protein
MARVRVPLGTYTQCYRGNSLHCAPRLFEPFSPWCHETTDNPSFQPFRLRFVAIADNQVSIQ